MKSHNVLFFNKVTDGKREASEGVLLSPFVWRPGWGLMRSIENREESAMRSFGCEKLSSCDWSDGE